MRSFRSSLVRTAALIGASLTLILAPTIAIADDTGCFVVKGRQLAAHPGATGASGRMATIIQHGSWDSRPKVRLVLFGPFGSVEAGTWSPNRFIDDIALDIDTAFVTGDFGLFSLDLSQSSAPSMLGYINLVDTEYLTLDGDLVYIVTSGENSGWLDVVDVSDPAEMVPRGQLTWGAGDPAKYDIEAQGSIVVIADDAGLLTVDVSDPDSPFELARWSAAAVRDVALVSSLAVLTPMDPQSPGVTIVDLSDPADPRQIGHWVAPSAVQSVAAYGAGVVLGTENEGIFLLDLTDPTEPVEVDHWNELGFKNATVSTAWPTITVSSTEFGLTILGVAPECLSPRQPGGRAGQ